jgi:hypothetical protein
VFSVTTGPGPNADSQGKSTSGPESMKKRVVARIRTAKPVSIAPGAIKLGESSLREMVSSILFDLRFWRILRRSNTTTTPNVAGQIAGAICTPRSLTCSQANAHSVSSLSSVLAYCLVCVGRVGWAAQLYATISLQLFGIFQSKYHMLVNRMKHWKQISVREYIYVVEATVKSNGVHLILSHIGTPDL